VNTTRRTLLQRVKNPADAEAWREFHALYAPLILRYASGQGLGAGDAEEIRDRCFEVLVQRLPGFDYARERGRFKAWLYRIVHGKVVDFLRGARPLPAESAAFARLADASPGPSELWEQSWRTEHLRFGLQEARARLTERTYRAFELLLLEGKSVTEVCAILEINANQVYKAKARALEEVRSVLERLGVE
jgi:RNA polymerase sigma-70 factor (ECF subfamily)